MSFEHARRIADAVLYEGYVLYPYRASSRKNQLRWQFGVLAPASWSQSGGSEAWAMQTECLVEAKDGPAPVLTGQVRCLQLQQRSVEEAVDAEGTAFRAVESLDVEGRLWTRWDEGIERVVELSLAVPDGQLSEERALPFAFAAAREVEPIRGESGRLVGRLVRETSAVFGRLQLRAERLDGLGQLWKFRVRVENLSPAVPAGAPRDEALRCSLVGTHTLLGVQGGVFLSLTDPPEWARAAAAACVNERTWPVLAGADEGRDVLLSSPIILADHPQIAPESPADMYDATEIDEILSLRTLALTDEEKREARSTDPRAAAIIDRVDAMPPEVFEKLHGAIRSVRPSPEPAHPEPPAAPWWDPGVDASVSPETDQVEVAGRRVARGSRVRLRPGVRRSDAQDMFVAGRTATVRAVFLDVENNPYLAVSLEDDPAADLHEWYGRYLYFSPDEVEPLEIQP